MQERARRARRSWYLKLLGRYIVEDGYGFDAEELIRNVDRRMLEAERRAEEAELRAMEVLEEVEGGQRWSRLRRRILESRNRLRRRSSR